MRNGTAAAEFMTMAPVPAKTRANVLMNSEKHLFMIDP